MSDNPDDLLSETPEDVAILYSWANLHGAKYRDFSASRREYRAQVRHRAAEDLRQSELQAKEQAETAAAEAESIAREAERVAAAPENYDSGINREHALREAESAARRAAAERVEAARRAEAAALAEAVARREEREIAEAHASAQRQAARYEEHESRRRLAAGPQPRPAGLQSDPYEFAQGTSVDDLYSPNVSLDYTQRGRDRDLYAGRASGQHRVSPSGGFRAFASADRRAYVSGERRIFKPVEPEQRRRPQGYRPDETSGIRPAFRPPSESAPPLSRPNSPAEYPRNAFGVAPDAYAPEIARPFDSSDRQNREARQARDARDARQAADDLQAREARQAQEERRAREERARQDRAEREQSTPAWLYAGNSPESSPAPVRPGSAFQSSSSPSSSFPSSSFRGAASSSPAAGQPTGSVPDTLQHSRERVASRWFALKGVFEPGQNGSPELASMRRQETRTPVLAIFSLAGGVGKTSMVATLGRALSSIGEKVLLADTTSHGLLPYYFGASELRPGVVRTFSPPAGSTDAPIYLVSYDLASYDPASNDPAFNEIGPRTGDSRDAFAAELGASAGGTQRILLDLNATSGWIMRRLPGMLPTVLVPVAPDMNSVISLQSVEKYFAGAVDSDGRAMQPYYILNQFDASLPLHLDVREVLRRQLGERLLPIVIRRAPAVSEALAEGMTVVDYAPDAGVTEDYINIASWLRSVSAPATQGFRNARWSER